MNCWKFARVASPVVCAALAVLLGQGCADVSSTDAIETGDSALDATAWAYDSRCTFADGILSACSVVYAPGGKYPAAKIRLQAGDRLTVSFSATSKSALRAWIVGPSQSRQAATEQAPAPGSAAVKGELSWTAVETGDHAIVVKSTNDEAMTAIDVRVVSHLQVGSMTGPFHPDACPGAALSYADTLRRIGAGQTTVSLPALPVLARVRSCNKATGCGAWREDPAHSYTLSGLLKVAQTNDGSVRPSVNVAVTPAICNSAVYCSAPSKTGPSELSCNFDPFAFSDGYGCHRYDIPRSTLTFKEGCFLFRGSMSDTTGPSSHDEYEFAGVSPMPPAVR